MQELHHDMHAVSRRAGSTAVCSICQSTCWKYHSLLAALRSFYWNLALKVPSQGLETMQAMSALT